MSVKGDFAKLSRLAGAFGSLRSKQSRVTRQCASIAVKLNKQSFAAHSSPDGEGWVSGPYYHGLRGRTGRLAGSFRATSSSTSFGVKNVARYAFYHQHGAHLRDSVIGKKTTAKSGPLRRGERRGRIKNKGRLRGFLPARPIVARGDIPLAWRPPLDRSVLTFYKNALRV